MTDRQPPLFQAYVWLVTFTCIDGSTTVTTVFGTAKSAHQWARRQVVEWAKQGVTVKPRVATIR